MQHHEKGENKLVIWGVWLHLVQGRSELGGDDLRGGCAQLDLASKSQAQRAIVLLVKATSGCGTAREGADELSGIRVGRRSKKQGAGEGIDRVRSAPRKLAIRKDG